MLCALAYMLGLFPLLFCIDTFPVVSLIVGEVVERVASEQGCEDPTRGVTSTSSLFNGTVECTQVAATTAITLCLLVGIIMVRCLGLMHQHHCIKLYKNAHYPFPTHL